MLGGGVCSGCVQIGEASVLHCRHIALGFRIMQCNYNAPQPPPSTHTAHTQPHSSLSGPPLSMQGRVVKSNVHFQEGESTTTQAQM